MEENPRKEPQTGAEPAAEPNANEPAQNEGTPDVKKEADNAAAVPSADELAAFRKWQESQKSEAEKQAAAIGKAEKAREAAEERAAEAELKLTAMSKGVSAEALSDVIALAKTKITDKSKTEYTAATTTATNTVSATASDPDAVIEIKNGSSAVTNGSAATWASGENVVTIKVTNGSAVKTYTVTVTKS